MMKEAQCQAQQSVLPAIPGDNKIEGNEVWTLILRDSL